MVRRTYWRQPAIYRMEHTMSHLIRLLTIAGCLMALSMPLFAAKFNKVVEIGQPAPEWQNLPGIDGRQHSLEEYKEAKLVVVIFFRNNCPVAQAYEERIRNFVEKYQSRGVTVVAINVSAEQGEGLELMQARAKDRKFGFPYLRDASQRIGKAYGATNTPHVFVLDQHRHIAYMGAIDDNNRAKLVEENYLADAVEELLAAKKVSTAETLQRGCQIEYKGE